MSVQFIPGKASYFYSLYTDGKIDGAREILDDKSSLPIDVLNQ